MDGVEDWALEIRRGMLPSVLSEGGISQISGHGRLRLSRISPREIAFQGAVTGSDQGLLADRMSVRQPSALAVVR